MSFDIDAFMEEMRERGRIRCPYCGTVYDDEAYEFISYHGSAYEDTPYQATCYTCEESFFVHESVIREYKTGKTLEEARGY